MSGGDAVKPGLREEAPALYDPDRDAVHGWFNLTYASYLALPRSVLQSMPGEWQVRLVALLDELGAKCEAHGIDLPTVDVRKRDTDGRWVEDPFGDYQRGRRNVFAEYPAKDPTP